MDHFHILDAYRANKKLVPLNADTVPDQDVLKAATMTIEKHDILHSAVKMRQRAHAITQTMLAFTAAIFVISTWNSSYPTGMKTTYTIVICCAFIVIGVLLYVFMFEPSIFKIAQTKKIYDELYRYEENKVQYGLQRQRMEEAEDEECAAQTPIDQASIEALRNAIRNGITYTIRSDASAAVEDSVTALRRLIGAETYRTAGEEDAYDIIDDVVVPMMIEARNSITSGKKGTFSKPADGEDDVCGSFCAETVKRLKADVLEGKKETDVTLLDEAWERCAGDMAEVCRSSELKTGANRCAFGCSNAAKIKPDVWVHALKSKIPDANWITLTETKPADSGEDSEPVKIETERACFAAATDDETIDAAYYGKSAEGGADACHVHRKTTPKGSFKHGVANFSGKLLLKEDANVDIPEGTPSAVAADIAMAIKQTGTVFDISDYDVHLYDTLRNEDADFEARKGFYEKTFLHVVEMIKPELDVDQDYLIPSMNRTNELLTGMTAREFQAKIAWPIAKASVFVHIRATRLNLQENYAPASEHVRLQKRYNAGALICAFGLLGTVAGYVAFAVDRGASRSANGRISLKELLFTNWHQHVVSLSCVIVVWTVIQSLIFRDHAKRVFNEKMKMANTEAFVSKLNELRDFLLDFTGALPSLRQDGNRMENKAVREELMRAVHTENAEVIGRYPDEEAAMIDVFDLRQKMKFVTLAQETIKAYDRCHNVGTENTIPFPTPEIMVYGTGIVILGLLMSFLHSTFDVADVARRVSRIRALRPKLFMGDRAAATEIAGLLECAESNAEHNFELTRNAMYGALGVIGILVTVMLVVGDDEFRQSLDSGFMLLRGQCLP